MAIRNDRPTFPRAGAGAPQGPTELRAGKDTRPNSVVKSSKHPIGAAERQTMICEAAYYIAEHRGFEAGHELEDWLLAETQVDATLTAR